MYVALVFEIVLQLLPLIDDSHLIILPTCPLSVNNPLGCPQHTAVEGEVIVPPTLCGIISIKVEDEFEVELPLCTTAL